MGIDNDSTDSGQIRLCCGNPSPMVADAINRAWYSDMNSKFAPSLLESSVDAYAWYPDPGLPSAAPYITARIFTSNYTYSFRVSSGRMFLRLYFFPITYVSQDSNNFNASQTALATNSGFFVLEYSVNVIAGRLDLTFSPSTHQTGSYAFINYIEIVPTPDLFTTTTPTLANGGNPNPFPIDPATGFQTMYRLNVGGQAISPQGDIDFYRQWDDDSPYIYDSGFGVSFGKDKNLSITYTPSVPNYTAPVGVYESARSMGPNAQVNLNYNLTWILPVDAGFYYLLRFHFCEIQYPKTEVNRRSFFIYINNQTAQQQMDVIAWSGGIGRTAYSDYAILTNGSGRMDLWVALHPDLSSRLTFPDALLNGLEVFKLQNDEHNSLAGLDPPLPSARNPNGALPTAIGKPGGRNSKGVAQAAAGGAAGGFAILLFACFGMCIICRCKKNVAKDYGMTGVKGNMEPRHRNVTPVPGTQEQFRPWHVTNFRKYHATFLDTVPQPDRPGDMVTMGRTNNKHLNQIECNNMPSNLCRHFTVKEIQAATNNFDETCLLGKGGFGNVYHGKLDDRVKVAIKRGNPLSQQGPHEFRTEIETLSMLRHRHLVSLIGYCNENNEMILVYDYMANGTLREHLYNTKKSPLHWKQRLEICIGTARGLHYLHTGAKQTIIHRDVKTANILLDDKLVAKVSDFGLSKASPDMDDTHVSTLVKGTFGYLDPEYFRRKQLTQKSDVYSFGVVLFEVLCARPVINTQLPEEQVSLRDWALSCLEKDVLSEIIDPHLQGEITPECFIKFAESAAQCVADRSIDRPSMSDVLSNLEVARQLQESSRDKSSGAEAMASRAKTCVDSANPAKDSTMSVAGQEVVFSDIAYAEGR
uniref:Protein kinase domain-containing protein n=1 Tax=Setaria italica TaxID=4555 RepID=K3Z3S1_SETIT